MKKTCNPQYETLIKERLSYHLRQPVVHLHPIPTFPDSIVYEAHCGGTDVIFKMIDPDGQDPDGIGLEAWANQQLAMNGIPGPEVVAVDSSKTVLPGSYFVMHKATGRPLDAFDISMARQPYWLHQVGALLRQMHAISLEGYGWLDETHFQEMGRVRGQAPTWRESVLKRFPDALIYLENQGLLELSTTDKVRRVIADHEGILNAVDSGCLLHGDLGMLHIFVDPHQEVVTSMVDFGERMSGDPVWDIVEYIGDVADYDISVAYTMLEGYEPSAEMVSTFEVKYGLYALLRVIPWAEKWYSRGATQTAKWLKFTVQEGLRHLGVTE